MGGSVSADESGLPPGVIIGALEELVGHAGLRLSERNRRFLDFVVRETLAGHADRIKAYTIGVDVFGRDQTFDPAVDPIVRIEANRVRSALAAYYDREGRNDRLRISMPAGTYVPTFAHVDGTHLEEQPTPTEVPATARSILVRDRSGTLDAESALRRDLFTNAVMRSLGQCGFKVFWSPSEADPAGALAVGPRLPASRCLDIAVHALGSHRRYSWRLWESDSSAVLLCDHCDLEVSNAPCVDLIDRTAEMAVRDVAAAVVKA
ncbi:hypothetical protein [Bosea sp. BH3]|uniref:hypothetical protein n=1 Tax=Bosea sp. BH3 TaxID=2871701 RepID=UPI0021CB0E2F|nr:hypothetical protein [Bosea sp. BH3]MCU4179869.1 hypothetical protein [Bosea sp. BH3]